MSESTVYGLKHECKQTNHPVMTPLTNKNKCIAAIEISEQINWIELFTMAAFKFGAAERNDSFSSGENTNHQMSKRKRKVLVEMKKKERMRRALN